MVMPTGYLKNTATGRFHPIVFRMAPMPGNADATLSAQRYKSLGHHTTGFDTLEAAQAHVTSEKTTLVDVGTIWDWDGEGIPAMIEWFNIKELTSA